MDVFEMVAIIVVVTTIGTVLRAWLRGREPRTVDTGSAARDQRIQQLEQRVAALEAVVGDQSFELKQKFRELERA